MAEKHVNRTEGNLESHANDGTRSIFEDNTTTTTIESTKFFTAMEELSSTSAKDQIGCASLPSDPEPSCSEYFSTHNQSVMEIRSEFETTLQCEVEASKVHWSKLDKAEDDEEYSAEKNLEVLKSLQKQWIRDPEHKEETFFVDWNDKFHVLGEKIAEGAQAEIFLLRFLPPEHAHANDAAVLKVFKPGFRLQDLQTQWPQGMLDKVHTSEEPYYHCEGCSPVMRGMVLKDGRFAFWMLRYWGDLCKLIDLRMKLNNNQGSPFADVTAFKIMFFLAKGMRELQKDGIVHRDLKAANVLIWPHVWKVDPISRVGFNPFRDDNFNVCIADYECSGGVQGTRFWRAPEILFGEKNPDIQENMFTEKSDVYSYAMTCYEILMGKMPLENVQASDYDAILQGKRPMLPSRIHPLIGKLLERCWHHEPSLRPSFQQIVEGFQRYGYS